MRKLVYVLVLLGGAVWGANQWNTSLKVAPDERQALIEACLRSGEPGCTVPIFYDNLRDRYSGEGRTQTYVLQANALLDGQEFDAAFDKAQNIKHDELKFIMSLESIREHLAQDENAAVQQHITDIAQRLPESRLNRLLYRYYLLLAPLAQKAGMSDLADKLVTDGLANFAQSDDLWANREEHYLFIIEQLFAVGRTEEALTYADKAEQAACAVEFPSAFCVNVYTQLLSMLHDVPEQAARANTYRTKAHAILSGTQADPGQVVAHFYFILNEALLANRLPEIADAVITLGKQEFYDGPTLGAVPSTEDGLEILEQYCDALFEAGHDDQALALIAQITSSDTDAANPDHLRRILRMAQLPAAYGHQDTARALAAPVLNILTDTQTWTTWLETVTNVENDFKPEDVSDLRSTLSLAYLTAAQLMKDLGTYDDAARFYDQGLRLNVFKSTAKPMFMYPVFRLIAIESIEGLERVSLNSVL